MLSGLAHCRRVQKSRVDLAVSARLLRGSSDFTWLHTGLPQGSRRRVVEALARLSLYGSVRLATLARSIQSSLRGGAGTLRVRGVHRRPTMRSSGPRGHSRMFPDVLSARGRLTRR
jgi:hypothetical protein